MHTQPRYNTQPGSVTYTRWCTQGDTHVTQTRTHTEYTLTQTLTRTWNVEGADLESKMLQMCEHVSSTNLRQVHTGTPPLYTSRLHQKNEKNYKSLLVFSSCPSFFDFETWSFFDSKNDRVGGRKNFVKFFRPKKKKNRPVILGFSSNSKKQSFFD